MKHPRNYLALVIGVCLFLVMLNSAYSAIEFYRSSVSTPGRIIRLQYGGYHPVIEFNTRDGRRYETSTNTWWSVDVGQVVPLRYKPDSPAHSVMLDRPVDLWMPTMFIALLTVFFVSTGLNGEKFRGDRF